MAPPTPHCQEVARLLREAGYDAAAFLCGVCVDRKWLYMEWGFNGQKYHGLMPSREEDGYQPADIELPLTEEATALEAFDAILANLPKKSVSVG